MHETLTRTGQIERRAFLGDRVRATSVEMIRGNNRMQLQDAVTDQNPPHMRELLTKCGNPLDL